jgi:hypothetical protein
MQAHLSADESALCTLRLREQLLQRQLHKSANQHSTPPKREVEYPQSLAPVASLCRQVVLEVADFVVVRTSFRPNWRQVAMYALTHCKIPWEG